MWSVCVEGCLAGRAPSGSRRIEMALVMGRELVVVSLVEATPRPLACPLYRCPPQVGGAACRLANSFSSAPWPGSCRPRARVCLLMVAAIMWSRDTP